MNGEFILWPDAIMERLEAGYDELTLTIKENFGDAKLLRCIGHLGFRMVGFWDELIIESAALHPEHPFTGECEHRVNALPPTGSPGRVAVGNQTLEIVFIDGCRLWICAGQFLCERA
jgi:hypothetical protein